MPEITASVAAKKKASPAFLLLLILGFFPAGGVEAIKCGTPLTTACFGDIDIRYDPDASNSIDEQAVIWKKREGLFRGEGSFRSNALVPFGPVLAAPDSSTVIVTTPFYEFLNATDEGSRAYHTSYTVAPLLPTEKVRRNIIFSTSTYEKDGTLVSFESLLNAIPTVPMTDSIIPTGLRSYPVDENTIYISTATSIGGLNAVTNTLRVCLDVNCDRFDESTNIYSVINGTVTRVYAAEMSFTRVATAEEWFEAIYDRYNESEIPIDERLDVTVPVCELGLCPTEEQWCETDPNCSESPYQEPPASVRGGVIAGFTIAGIVILVIVLYLIHRHLLARQAQRYRTVFAKRIADTIEVRGSMRALPPDALAEEFNRIDAGVKDGKLSKEEMWEFVSSGKAGEMNKHDFDALFAAIDLDGSGNIDFLEFCAFMSKCHDEYRAARVDRGSIVARRVSAASTAFVKVPEDAAFEEENA